MVTEVEVFRRDVHYLNRSFRDFTTIQRKEAQCTFSMSQLEAKMIIISIICIEQVRELYLHAI